MRTLTWLEQHRGRKFTRLEYAAVRLRHWFRTFIWNQAARDFGAHDPAHLERVIAWVYIAIFWNTYAYRLRDWYCKKRGHAWVDESYGGPDSGCMAGYCTRCGNSFHTRLY